MQDKQEALDRGVKAGHELELVTEAIELFDSKLIDALRNSKVGDDNGRRNLVQALQVSRMVLEYLTLEGSKAKHVKGKIKDIQKIGSASILERIIP